MKTLFVVMLTAGSLLAQDQTGRQKEDLIKAKGVVTLDFPNGVNVHTGNVSTLAFVHDLSLGPIVKNAPYSAEAVTETVQQLFDGNRIVQRETSKLYRDIQGRERREESSPVEAVFISDPVAGESYTLHPDSMTAEKRPFATPVSLTTVQPGLSVAYVRTKVGTTAPARTFFFSNQGNVVVLSPSAEMSEPKEESLGTQNIEGVDAEGTRVTTTIPAGSIGNERDIDIVDERWFSPDLQTTVMTRHSDPRSGENTYKLTNIQRVEQVRSLFEIPSGYTINETGANLNLRKTGTVRAK